MSQVAGKPDPSIDGWSEIQDLLQQTQQENTAMRQQLEILRLENRVLKDKLKVLCDTESNDSRTDNEKAMLLGLDSSDATNDRTASIEESLEESAREQSYIIADANGDQVLPGFPSSSSEGSVIPDEPSNVSDGNWDDLVSSEGEGSVACLQDRIHQMEENHYTVNEELQATLQELTDLQENVNELTLDNEKLNEEKKSVIEVLYKQMERVKKLSALADLLKSQLEEHSLEFDQEEFEESFNKSKSSEGLELDSQESLEGVTEDEEERQKLSDLLDEHRKETHTEIGQLKDNLHEMQDLLHTHYEEKECIYEQLMLVKSQLANREVELQRVKGQMNETKAKMADILQYQDPEGSLDLAALLDKSSKEKEKLEAQIVQLEEEVREAQEHADKLQEEVETMEEDVEGGQKQVEQEMQMVKDMMDELNGEKQELETEVINLKETIMEMEEACERHEQDKQQHLTTISDLNNAVQTLRKEKNAMHRELTDLKRTSTADSEEWMQFQKDLQKAVVIANDYRNEAQEEVSELIREKDELQDKLKSLNAEVDRLRKLERLNTASSPPIATTGRTSLGSSETEIRQRMQAYMKTNDKAGNRKGGAWNSQQQPLSVKNLIKTIESAAAQDTPKLPTNSEIFNGNEECSSPPPRPMLERRNTTIAVTKSYESKPQYTRRATQSVTSPTEPRKAIASTKLFQFDEMTSPTKDSRSAFKPLDMNHHSPDTPPKTPTTRSEARQAISDALFMRSDFMGRKPGITSPSSSKDFADASGGTDSLSNKSPVGASGGVIRRNPDMSDSKKDPLTALVKIGGGGSKRNALLKWCQQKTLGYKGIDITNFSSSWNDGLAFCALMHNYLPDQIPFRELNTQDKRRNFTLAFKAAESLGIASILDIDDMVKMERPDWQSVMTYVTSIYKLVET